MNIYFKINLDKRTWTGLLYLVFVFNDEMVQWLYNNITQIFLLYLLGLHTIDIEIEDKSLLTTLLWIVAHMYCIVQVELKFYLANLILILKVVMKPGILYSFYSFSSKWCPLSAFWFMYLLKKSDFVAINTKKSNNY